ncbi:MAG: N-acetylmuramic acid 6-phosphate etherase [Gemmatimonadota bacterium]|nr:N-acetylmuramic acid 6-phosphate etherase [Gemmatimonadota bacterium]
MRDIRATEQRNPRSANIDLATAREIVDLMNHEDATVPGVVAGQAAQIARAVELAVATFNAGGRLFYVGAGTSGRLGVLDASECPPTFGTDPDMVQGIIAGGVPALTRSQEGAEDSPERGARELDDRAISSRDFVIGIAASGTTPFVHGAIHRARAVGARTAIVACTQPPETLLAACDVAIIPVVGPEVVTGSTRLKAGTATKLVLNTITTGAMILLGKTYGNLMIDMRATNAKLTDRADRIVMEVTGASRDRAREQLFAAGGVVKLAIVMQALGVDRGSAEQLLAEQGGIIRRVIPGAPPPVSDA